MSATHRFEESDELRLVVEADSFPAALAEAGRALAELAFGAPAPAADLPPVEIEVCAADRAALLVEWLNELIFRAESEGWLAVSFEALDVSPTSLRARVGRRGWPLRSLPVKAATLHGAAVLDRPPGLVAEVTLDL